MLNKMFLQRLIIFIVVIIISVLAFILFRGQQSEKVQRPALTFSNPKKSAHYETNAPSHGSILAAVPLNVVIDFNFDLMTPSAISITKDGVEYGQGETIIDSNGLSMRRVMNPKASDGLYGVNYKACWPDQSCHNGYFQFATDSKKFLPS